MNPIIVLLDVGRSVGWPVCFWSITLQQIDELVSYYVQLPWTVDDHYRNWAHLVKGQSPCHNNCENRFGSITRHQIDQLAWYFTYALALDIKWPLLKLGSLGEVIVNNKCENRFCSSPHELTGKLETSHVHMPWTVDDPYWNWDH